MRWERSEWPRPGRTARARTARRLAAAAERAADESLTFWPRFRTAEERLDQVDAADARYAAQLRACTATLWRRGRAILYAHPPHVRAILLDRWNLSGRPATAEYFADFMRWEEP